MNPPVYCDHNATTPVRPEAAQAMMAAMETVGNPSSVHRFGRTARRVVEDARDAVAALIGASGANIVFTSGGTEANNLALTGLSDHRVLVSAIEHPSVLESREGAQRLPVGSDGVVDPDALEAALAKSPGPCLVSVMLANNETGVIQPVAEVCKIAARHGARVHCDGVQAAGKIAVDMAGLGVDMLSLSAHKIGGPQGIGALVLRDGLSLNPVVRGGGQERGRRGGTENVPGLAGFGTAAILAREALGESAKLEHLRDRLEGEIRSIVPEMRVFGADAPRLPNTSCFAVSGVSSEVLLPALDLEGIATSSGSACSSGKVAASHVLAAMGGGELARNAIRVSFGWTSREADVERFVAAWRKVCSRFLETAAAREV